MGAVVVRSTSTNSRASSTAAPNTSTVPDDPKPCCCLLLSPYSSAAADAVTKAAPNTSMRCLPVLLSSGIARGMSISRTAMMGRLTRKIARQPRYWVRTPPAITPTDAPAAVVACQMLSARLRAAPSALVVVSSDSAEGETNAAPTPCTKRDRISMSGERARPQVSEASAKSVSPSSSKRRRPNRSPARPPSSEPQFPLHGRKRDIDDAEVQLEHELCCANQCQHTNGWTMDDRLC